MNEPENFRIVEPNGGTSLHWTIISSTRGTIAQAFSSESAQRIVEGLRGRNVAPKWVVNSNAELGVELGGRFFFLYKGENIVYRNDDGSLRWRPVFKREFGECCHPVNEQNPGMNGDVSPDDGEHWEPLPFERGGV